MLKGELFVFQGIHTNKWFILISAITFGVQALAVEVLGKIFMGVKGYEVGLMGVNWAICLAFSAGSFLWYFVVIVFKAAFDKLGLNAVLAKVSNALWDRIPIKEAHVDYTARVAPDAPARTSSKERTSMKETSPSKERTPSKDGTDRGSGTVQAWATP